MRYPMTLLMMIFFGWLAGQEQPPSLLDLPATILAQDGPALFQYWEIAQDRTVWSTESSAVPALQAYRDSLALTLGEEELLHILLFESSQQHPPPLPPDTLDNYALVHTGRLGRIRSINWLEAELLNYQLSRYPLLGHPTEFHGFIAVHESLPRVRIYFAASDQPWPPKPGPIIPHLEQALTEGWRLRYHLHNHYDPPGEQYVGALAPSLADAQYFKALRERFGLPHALITNGFHTVVLPADTFEQFFSH
jgi:hypothetical protein